MRICTKGEIRYVTYSKERLLLLGRLRKRALELMLPLRAKGYSPYLCGSVARGDVDEESDIDIVLLDYADPVIIESIYQLHGISFTKKLIVQATPTHTPKLYFYFDVDEKEVLGVPLSTLRKAEYDFYKFGGLLDHDALLKGIRVPGVNKRLMLITPTEYGHVEECILGKEGYVASVLNVSEEVVRERVRKLKKREERGRTGTYIEYVIKEDVTEAIEYLRRVNKYFRKAIERTRG